MNIVLITPAPPRSRAAAGGGSTSCVNSGRSHIQDLSDEDIANLVQEGILEATADARPRVG